LILIVWLKGSTIKLVKTLSLNFVRLIKLSFQAKLEIWHKFKLSPSIIENFLLRSRLQ